MTFVQQRQAVGVEAGEREVVHRRHHCQPALVPHAINQFQRLLLVPDVECTGRFVEQQHRRALGDRASQDQPLRLAAAERAEHPVGERRQIEALQDVVGDHAILGADTAEVADERAATQQHVVEHRHVCRQHRRLRHVCHPPRPLACGHRRGLLAGDGDDAAVRGQTASRA